MTYQQAYQTLLPFYLLQQAPSGLQLIPVCVLETLLRFTGYAGSPVSTRLAWAVGHRYLNVQFWVVASFRPCLPCF